jgi:hypothetical protein
MWLRGTIQRTTQRIIAALRRFFVAIRFRLCGRHMKVRQQKSFDPAKMFVHACGYVDASNILSHKDVVKTEQMLASIANPVMMIQAFSIELFLKTIICIERNGFVPPQHHLKWLFSQLSPRVQQRITEEWDTKMVPLRKSLWDELDTKFPHKFARDLPTILARANRAFEQLRYNYEGHRDLEFHTGLELPRVLITVILELKPEFRGIQFRPTSPVR